MVLAFEAVVPRMGWQPSGASLSSLANEPLVLSSKLFLKIHLMAQALLAWRLYHLAGILGELCLHEDSF